MLAEHQFPIHKFLPSNSNLFVIFPSVELSSALHHGIECTPAILAISQTGTTRGNVVHSSLTIASSVYRLKAASGSTSCTSRVTGHSCGHSCGS